MSDGETLSPDPIDWGGKKKINLALQGGGSHGAFTWGVLDAILEAFIEEDLSVDELEARGFDRATVGRVLDLVKRNEYKRRQAPPGVRVSRRAFGRDWRYPITNGYRR